MRAGVAQHVALVLDLGPGIVRWFVDGAPLDGGEAAERGWGRIVGTGSGGSENDGAEGQEASESADATRLGSAIDRGDGSGGCSRPDADDAASKSGIGIAMETSGGWDGT